MKKIRIVINNEAYVDVPTADEVQMGDLVPKLHQAGGFITGEVFVPYNQIQAIFLYTDDITATFNISGMTKQ